MQPSALQTRPSRGDGHRPPLFHRRRAGDTGTIQRITVVERYLTRHNDNPFPTGIGGRNSYADDLPPPNRTRPHYTRRRSATSRLVPVGSRPGHPTRHPELTTPARHPRNTLSCGKVAFLICHSNQRHPKAVGVHAPQHEHRWTNGRHAERRAVVCTDAGLPANAGGWRATRVAKCEPRHTVRGAASRQSSNTPQKPTNHYI